MGYADDTYVLAGSLQELVPPLGLTEQWLQDTGQGVNAGKSVCFSTEAGAKEAARVVRMGEESFPYKEEFRVLGFGIRIQGGMGLGPLLRQRMARACSLLK